MKAQAAIGLDIGEHYLKMVKLAGELANLKLMDFACISLISSQGKEEKLSQLEKLVQEKAIAGLGVNIGVSGESVIVRYIDLPKMKKDELAQALKFEAQQYIPFKIDEVIFDYHILTSLASASNRMKILLVAAKKEAITSTVEFIQQAGLKVNLIDVSSFSLINCFQANGPKVKEDEVLALVNLELELVNIIILQGEMPFFTRDISFLEEEGVFPSLPKKVQGREFLEKLRPQLANLIRELRLSIDYFESEFSKPVNIIYLSGKGAGIPEMVNFFNSELGKEVKLWNPLQNLLTDPAQINQEALTETSPMLALACGLALRSVR